MPAVGDQIRGPTKGASRCLPARHGPGDPAAGRLSQDISERQVKHVGKPASTDSDGRVVPFSIAEEWPTGYRRRRDLGSVSPSRSAAHNAAPER
jgi:hypothetical protein